MENSREELELFLFSAEPDISSETLQAIYEESWENQSEEIRIKLRKILVGTIDKIPIHQKVDYFPQLFSPHRSLSFLVLQCIIREIKKFEKSSLEESFPIIKYLHKFLEYLCREMGDEAWKIVLPIKLFEKSIRNAIENHAAQINQEIVREFANINSQVLSRQENNSKSRDGIDIQANSDYFSIDWYQVDPSPCNNELEFSNRKPDPDIIINRNPLRFHHDLLKYIDFFKFKSILYDFTNSRGNKLPYFIKVLDAANCCIGCLGSRKQFIADLKSLNSSKHLQVLMEYMVHFLKNINSLNSQRKNELNQLIVSICGVFFVGEEISMSPDQNDLFSTNNYKSLIQWLFKLAYSKQIEDYIFEVIIDSLFQKIQQSGKIIDFNTYLQLFDIFSKEMSQESAYDKYSPKFRILYLILSCPSVDDSKNVLYMAKRQLLTELYEDLENKFSERLRIDLIRFLAHFSIKTKVGAAKLFEDVQEMNKENIERKNSWEKLRLFTKRQFIDVIDNEIKVHRIMRIMLPIEINVRKHGIDKRDIQFQSFGIYSF
ncbi:MAG: hypothetical protein MHMPM18_000492 [Marteilia pararefringens]